jgi:hypothetical protein
MITTNTTDTIPLTDTPSTGDDTVTTEIGICFGLTKQWIKIETVITTLDTISDSGNDTINGAIWILEDIVNCLQVIHDRLDRGI